ncbi:restriction endonuclease subunit S, partial [Lactobacillus delbrueckii subsp. bulgaricus]
MSEKSYEKNTDNKYSTVLTNSAEYGIVKQRDFFDKDIANSSNISGYYVVRKNYFVYNPRISNQAKFGPINRNKLDESGIMSPLYLVFTVHDIDESFLETLFQTTTWHRFMYQNGDTGARADRFAIKDSTFMSMPIKVPSLEEQHKLALAFQKLDQTITLHEEKKRQLERLKSALLQKM